MRKSSLSAMGAYGKGVFVVDSEQIVTDVRSIAFPKGRKVGTSGHERARKYLTQRMSGMGLSPYSGNSFDLSYSMGKEKFHNLIGKLPGHHPEFSPVLIGAHYDSVIAAECADDNAAAVAIALSAANMLKTEPLIRDVIVALFDAEEPPHYLSESMGSIRFFKDQKDNRGIHAAIIMDLVGHDVTIPLEKLGMQVEEPLARRTKDILFITGAESDSEMERVLKESECPANLPIIPALNRYVGDMSDHHVFRNNHVPYLFLSCGRWPHYHSEADTVDRLNFDKMARVAGYVVQLATRLAITDFSGSPWDPVSLEKQKLKEVLDSFFPLLLKCLGLKGISTRKDLDRIAEFFLSAGL